MKKGILTTLLLASGAALAVYLLKEEQDKKLEIDEEKRMIKIRSDEEDKELVRTIQEIESLPVRQIEPETIYENSIERDLLNDFQETPLSIIEVDEDQFVGQDNEILIPSFLGSFGIKADNKNEELINELPEIAEETSEAQESQENHLDIHEETDAEGNDIDIPSFVDSTVSLNETDFEELLNTLPINEEVEEENEIEANNEIQTDIVDDIRTDELVETSSEIYEQVIEDTDVTESVEENTHDSIEDSLKFMFERQYPNASEEVLDELIIPNFESMVSPTKLSDEVLKPIFDEDEVEIVLPTMDSKLTEADFFDHVEIPSIGMPKLDEDDMSKTAVFDLPSSFRNESLGENNTSFIKAPINPFADDLEEIDLSELFSKMDDEDAVDLSSLFEETSEMKLVDIDEEEIKKLFTIDSQDDLEEIHLTEVIDDTETVNEDKIKKELTVEEFEDFRKRLVHIGEDDIDLINFNDSNPFETTNHLVDEIDIINFGNIVEEPTVALEDLVLDKPIELLAQESHIQEEIQVEETELPQVDEFVESREYPNAVYDIHKLYPFLNHKFINAVFNNFGDFIQEFEVGSSCRITHRVQFPDAQKLISFIEVTKEYGYEIVGTDDDHNILLTLDFVNEESKILSEIYNISNQVNCLDGIYRGYELEHI